MLRSTVVPWGVVPLALGRSTFIPWQQIRTTIRNGTNGRPPYEAPRPIGLDTANGKISLTKQVDTDVEVLSLQLTALLAEKG